MLPTQGFFFVCFVLFFVLFHFFLGGGGGGCFRAFVCTFVFRDGIPT